MNYKLSQKGYILTNKNEIEPITYREYLYIFGSDETTTGRGVAPRLYVDGKNIYTWGVGGNNHKLYHTYQNNREATKALYQIWEYNLEKDWDRPTFFATKNELFEYFSESRDRDLSVVKRYFKLLKSREKRIEQEKLEAKKEKEILKQATKENILNYIKNNRQVVQSSLNQLNLLKMDENKSEWQIKANSLVQKVSGNDFRALNWKEIYNLIKENC